MPSTVPFSVVANPPRFVHVTDLLLAIRDAIRLNVRAIKNPGELVASDIARMFDTLDEQTALLRRCEEWFQYAPHKGSCDALLQLECTCGLTALRAELEEVVS